MLTTRQRIVAAVLVVIVVGVLATFTSLLGPPKAPAVDSWYQREIIGQGELMDVSASGDDLLISLRLMMAESTAQNITYTTLVYHLDGTVLAVSDTWGDNSYLDVKVFELGTYYTLFRKVDPLRYLLLAVPGAPPHYPVVVGVLGGQ